MTRMLKIACAALTLGLGAGAAHAVQPAQTSGGDVYAQAGQGGPGGLGMRRGRRGGPGAGLEMLRLADLNRDNTVTRAEMRQLRGEMFAFRDRNGDGFLDREDASPIQQRALALREAEGAGDRRQRGRRGGARMMERMDVNGDMRVSREEFVEAENRLFNRADANSDGAVTPAELDQLVEDAQSRRAQRRFWWRG